MLNKFTFILCSRGWPSQTTVYFKVYLGSIDIFEATHVFYPNDIQAVIAHEEYNVTTRASDIGMMIFYFPVPNRNLSKYYLLHFTLLQFYLLFRIHKTDAVGYISTC